MDVTFRLVYNLCMMLVMVKEADLAYIDVAEDYEVLDATALGRRLGFKRDTVLAYLSRRNFGRIPRPNRLLAMGPLWYEKSEEGRVVGCGVSGGGRSECGSWGGGELHAEAGHGGWPAEGARQR